MTITHKGARCTLAKLYGSTWELASMDVPESKRGLGLGSALMKKACELADHRGLVLVALVEPSGGLSRNQIEAWNERNGFEHCRYEFYPGTPKGAMIRRPKEKGLTR
jgi:GNAT superfamily N-acetyltransferase